MRKQTTLTVKQRLRWGQKHHERSPKSVTETVLDNGLSSEGLVVEFNIQ